MKTAREMLAKLKRLEGQIVRKNRELKNLITRQKMASQGNMKFVNGRINKNTYTNANYMRNIHNAMRIMYNERKPLMNTYNKSAKKYRGIVGLPNAGMPGYVRGPPYKWAWEKINHVHFSRSKKNTNGPSPNVTNLYIKYQPIGATSASGGGARNSRVSLGGYYTKFHPNIQLMNTILKRNKATETIREALYRPPKMNGLPGGLGPKGGRLYAKLVKNWKGNRV